MSLKTDAIFLKALTSSEAVTDIVGNRIYGASIQLPDEDVDNVDVPYIIVTFDGMQNGTSTKDDPYEDDTDTVNIGIEITAKNLDDLHDLTALVRKTIHDYFVANIDTDDEVPYDYRLSAQGIVYDSLKPCFWQILNFQCDTTNGY